MLIALHKLLLSFLILIIAIATQLDFKDNDILVNKTANLNIHIDKCYRKISDFLDYPEWMSMVSDVNSLDLPTNVNVGTEFTTVTNVGILGTMEQRNVILTLVRNKQFSFSTESLFITETDFNFTSTSQIKCALSLKIKTKQNNIFFKKLMVPILRLYYGNWATQSLITFKMKTS